MAAGMSTLFTAIPEPSSTVPRNSPNGPHTALTSIPAVINPSMNTMARSMPKRRPSQGATNARAPKHSTGRLVRRLAATLPSPYASWIFVRIGATLMIGARMARPATSTVTPPKSAPAWALDVMVIGGR